MTSFYFTKSFFSPLFSQKLALWWTQHMICSWLWEKWKKLETKVFCSFFCQVKEENLFFGFFFRFTAYIVTEHNTPGVLKVWSKWAPVLHFWNDWSFNRWVFGLSSCHGRSHPAARRPWPTFAPATWSWPLRGHPPLTCCTATRRTKSKRPPISSRWPWKGERSLVLSSLWKKRTEEQHYKNIWWNMTVWFHISWLPFFLSFSFFFFQLFYWLIYFKQLFSYFFFLIVKKN